MSENKNEIPIRLRSSILYALGEELHINKNNNVSCGLLVVKILSLNEINTMYGYETGDIFIHKLSLLTHEIFPKENMIIRVGNDEFAILLRNILNKNHILLAINKILENLTLPLAIKGEQVHSKVKIGVALFPDDAEDEEQLLICADIALDKALIKDEIYSFYSKQNIFNGYSSLIISHELDSAIDGFELSLQYQPKIDFRTKTICGSECLMRWSNSKMGPVPPDVFIPIAESAGQIIDLTIWSMNVSLKHAQQLHSRWSDFQIAINLSPAVLYEQNVIQLIQNAINMWSIDPETIMLEVTESAVMLDPQRSLEILKGMTDLGLNLSIDDFGTGYSSLAYLKSLPVTELKIDKSFVSRMDVDEDDKMIVRSIIELAHNFNLSVTAEGVENKETMVELELLGCDKAQGYYFSHPLIGSDLVEFIQSSEWKLAS